MSNTMHGLGLGGHSEWGPPALGRGYSAGAGGGPLCERGTLGGPGKGRVGDIQAHQVVAKLGSQGSVSRWERLSAHPCWEPVFCAQDMCLKETRSPAPVELTFWALETKTNSRETEPQRSHDRGTLEGTRAMEGGKCWVGMKK